MRASNHVLFISEGHRLTRKLLLTKPGNESSQDPPALSRNMFLSLAARGQRESYPPTPLTRSARTYNCSPKLKQQVDAFRECSELLSTADPRKRLASNGQCFHR